jgi:CubicO group peptidase (beta-lactamase class C family)
MDGLIYVTSIVMLDSARRKAPVPVLARWLLGLGIAATVAAKRGARPNWLQGPGWLYSPWMLAWSEVIDPVADQNGFAGVVSVHRGGETEFAQAYGLADRARRIPNTVGTRFAIASGTKGLTALTVVSLINDNVLAMSTTARSVLGADLPLIGDDVTIEHLLACRSGIGDYLDEEAGYDVTGYLLTVPPQNPATTEQYLAVLGGYPRQVPPWRAVLLTAGMSCWR